MQVRFKSDKAPEKKVETKEAELSPYDDTITPESLVQKVQTEADLAKVPPDVMVQILPKPIESRNRVLIIGAGKCFYAYFWSSTDRSIVI